MRINRPALKPIGLDLSEKTNSSRPKEGVDFPAGIEHLDVGWFERSITIETLAACRNEDDLWRLQQDARWILELRALKLRSEGA